MKGDVHAVIEVCIPREEKEWKLDGIALWCVIGPQGENEEGPILRDILTWRESRTKARGVCVRKPQTNCFDIEMLSASIDICCSRRSCFLLWIKSGTFLSCNSAFSIYFYSFVEDHENKTQKQNLAGNQALLPFIDSETRLKQAYLQFSRMKWGRNLLWENHNYIVQLWFRRKTMIAFYHGSTLRNQIS